MEFSLAAEDCLLIVAAGTKSKLTEERELQPRSSACLFGDSWDIYIISMEAVSFLLFPLKEMQNYEFDIFAKPLKPAVLKFSSVQNPWDRFARFSN